jgi:mono/diheme cytochrome c family protein
MAGSTSGDGLVRWLLGGLVVGAIVLGLLVGAYEIGYHRGKEKRTTPAAVTAPAAPTRPTSTTPPPTSPAGSAAAAVAEGKRLFSADACAGCHSLNGTAGAGPTLEAVAGSSVTLADGTTVTADDAYLTKSIVDPDAQIVNGYQAGVMSAAVKSLGLRSDQIAALVAYLKTQH